MMQNLKSLFSNARINYIVSVDDCYDEATLIDDLTLLESCEKNIEEFKQFCTEHKRSDIVETINTEDDFRDYLEGVIASFDEEVKRELKNYLGAYAQQKASLKSFCETLKENGIILEYYTCSNTVEAKGFFAQLQEAVPINSENRILWLIDNDFSATGGTSSGGQVLIDTLLAESVDGHIFALASAQTSLSETNESFRATLTNAFPNKLLLACLVKKQYILESDYGHLYSDMCIGFQQNCSGEILTKLTQSLDAAVENSKITLSRLSTDAINQVVFLGSKNDGIAPFETFQRMMMIILKSDVMSSLGENYDVVSKLIFNYLELCTWGNVETSQTGDFETVQTLRENECYDKSVNARYAPVGYGDIYKIDGKIYLLLGQACDIAVRAKGTRKVRSATLVEIKKDTGDAVLGNEFYELKYFEKHKLWKVSFNDCITMDFSILDLCALNLQGKLLLPAEFDLESVRFRYTEGVYKLLQKVIENHQKLKTKYDLLGKEKERLTLEELFKRVREIQNENPVEMTMSASGCVDYKSQRICRIDKERMDDIIQKYSVYRSRKGMGFDFAANYKAYTFSINYDFDVSVLGLQLKDFGVLSQYSYFCKDVKDKKIADIKKDALVMFCNDCQNQFGVQKCEIHDCSCDKNELAIKVSSNVLPVKIQNEFWMNVLQIKQENISVNIPITCASDFLKNNKSTTYYLNDGSDSPKAKVSNKGVKFVFKHGEQLVFENDLFLKRALRFKFIAKENHVELDFE